MRGGLRAADASETTRRAFIFGAVSAGAVGCTVLRGGEKPGLTLGVLSDIHVRDDTSVLERAFRHFADAGCDGVVIAGDLADVGLLSQLRRVGDAWRRVFPGDRDPRDGRHVEKLFIFGNHDVEGFKYGLGTAYRKRGMDIDGDIIANVGMEKAWRIAFDEEFAPIWRKDVNGFRFYGAHWSGSCGVCGLGEFYEKERANIDPSRPFFHIQHPHPRGTCHGPESHGVDDGSSTAALSAFSNAIAISGHSHQPLTDDRAVWQGAFTSIGASSLWFSGLPRSCTKFRAWQPGWFLTHDGRQGMVMRVFDGRIEIERMDFWRSQSLGPDWIVPMPPRCVSRFSRPASAPAFASGVRVHAGRTGDGGAFLRIPPAAGASSRAYTFAVSVREDGSDKPAVRKTVVSRAYHLPCSCDTMDTICPFAAAELPRNPVFEVSPVSSLGAAGAPVRCRIEGVAAPDPAMSIIRGAVGHGVGGRLTLGDIEGLWASGMMVELNSGNAPGDLRPVFNAMLSWPSRRLVMNGLAMKPKAVFDLASRYCVAEQIVFAGCTEDLRQWRVASGNGAAMSRWEGFAADIADTVELDANDPDVGTKAEAVRRERRKIAIDVRNVCGDVEKARRRITGAINPDAFICSSESCRAWI